MLNVIIFGAPGSGKGTQSEMLIKEYGFDHISTGDLLRAEIKAGSELGLKAKEYMDAGRLVPDEVVIGMIDDKLKKNTPKVGIIFDGFPRTIPQAEALGELLKKYGSEIKAVLDLEVDEDELIRRLINRGKESDRSDDNLETIQSRLKVYHDQTSPLANYYRELGVHHHIPGMGKIEDITSSIKKVIDKFL